MKDKTIKTLIPILSVILFLLIMWQFEFRNSSMPIQHITSSFDNTFFPTTGNIREIYVRTYDLYEKINPNDVLTVNIYDEKLNEVYSFTSGINTITSSPTLIASFEKQSPLRLNKQKYIVKSFINELEIDNLRYIIVEFDGSYKSIYTVFSLLIIGSIIVFYYFSKRIYRIEWMYVFSIITLCLLYMYIFPPLGVPDEELHFYQSYRLSNRLLQYEDLVDGYFEIRVTDNDCISYLGNAASLSSWYQTTESVNDSKKILVKSNNNINVTTKAKYTYLPSALGITLCRLLNFNGRITLIVGRLFTLFTVIIITFWAIKIIPYGKYFIYALALLPESIYLSNSFSYDGINLALCMLIVSYFLLLYSKNKIEFKQLLLLFLLIVFMIPIKFAYSTFLALLFFLPVKKIAYSNKKTVVAISSAFLILSSVIAACYKTIYAHLFYTGGEGQYNIAYLLQNFSYTISITLRTLIHKSSNLFVSSFGQIIGRAHNGLLELYNISLFSFIMVLILILICLYDCSNNCLTKHIRIGISIISILSIFSILAIMLLSATPINSYTIDGLQGRYLLPIYTLLPLIINKTPLRPLSNIKNTVLFLILFINISFVFFAFYHYSIAYFG